MKNLLFIHMMCYKADHQQILCFQRPPFRNCNVQVLSKRLPKTTEMCKYSAFKLHSRGP